MKNLQQGQNVSVCYQGANIGKGYNGVIIRAHSDSYDIDLVSQPYGTRFMVPQDIVFPRGETLYHVVSFDLTRKDFSQRCCVIFTSVSSLEAEKINQKLRRAAYRSCDMKHLHFVHKYENGLKVEYKE